jgi:hypothetical protein
MYLFRTMPVMETATMTASEPVSQNQTPAPDSIWRQSNTSAVLLTVLASCAIAIDVHNPVEALGNLFFTVPVTFLFCWVICAFLIWVWRTLGRISKGWTK